MEEWCMRRNLKRIMAYVLVASMLIPEGITFAAEDTAIVEDAVIEATATAGDAGMILYGFNEADVVEDVTDIEELTDATTEEDTAVDETLVEEISTEEATEEATEETVEEYTITYENILGAKKNNNPATYVLSDEAVTLEPISCDGYKFLGWYSDDLLTQEITEIPAETTGDITIYADWELETYTIRYALKGGVLSETNPSSYTVQDDDFILNAPTKEGYTFDGWYKGFKFINVSIGDNSSGSDTEAEDSVEDYRSSGWPLNNSLLYVDQNGIITKTERDAFYTDMHHEDLVLVATWKANKYTLVLNGQGGAYYGLYSQKLSCTYDKEIDLSQYSYRRNGYTFAGWNTKADGTGTWYSGTVSNLTGEADGEVNLYAIWTKYNYTITYVLNGGTNNSANPSTYDVESSVNLAKPTRTGYTFAGWYYDSDFTTSVSTIPEGTDLNLTLYAKWIPNQYYIVFNGNGSTSGSMSKMTNTYNTTYKLSANVYQKSGYGFAGWNTKADGTGESYSNLASIINPVSASGSTYILYAQWKKINYTITYNVAGGTNNKDNPVTYNVDSTVALSAPAKNGYIFAGWYSDSSFKNKVTGISKGNTGNKTFYAKWEPIKYSIVFKGNGNTSGSMKTMKNCSYNLTYSLSQNGFVRNGYTFTGWNTQANGSGKSYTDNTKIKNLTAKNKGKITLYAQWKPVKYKITYVLNGGTNSTKNPAGYNTTQDISLKKPVKAGYTFKGWYSDKGFNNKVTSIKKGSYGNKKLYAKWSVNTYTIKFNGNGSTAGSMSSVKNRVYSKAYKLPKNNYTRKNYSFTGWNTKKDGTGTAYSNSAKVKNLTIKNKGTVTLYAQWKVKKYSITYVLNGGTNNSSNPSAYNVESSKIVLANPTRSGYTFVGWYTDAAMTKPVKAIAKGSAGNKTLYAKWKSKTNNVTSGGNGNTGNTNTGNTNTGNTNTGNTNTGNTNTGNTNTGNTNTGNTNIGNTNAGNTNTVTYTITYNMNGGTNSSLNPASYSPGETITLNSPTRTNYNFGGWYLDEDLTNEIAEISADSTGNITLYAKWNVQYVWTTCTYCGGSGRKTCISCFGAKSKTCAGCFGKGYSYNSRIGRKTCSVCYGSGKKTCMVCSGQGSSTCGSCLGSGTMVAPATSVN
jgi:uncharacterized repeat protein (TIGR02543 family)